MRQLKAEEAESLVRLAQSSDGKLFFGVVSEEFDKVMQQLLAAPPDELASKQGEARALQNVLKVIDSAYKFVNK